MPLREDLLNPIAGENPSGVDVRYDTKLLLYDKIKEARRQDDDLAQGDWQHERKVGRLCAGCEVVAGSPRHADQRPATRGLADGGDASHWKGLRACARA